MASDLARGIDRRRLLGWSGLAAAGVTLAGAPRAFADPAPLADGRFPPDALPGGATTATWRSWPSGASSPVW